MSTKNNFNQHTQVEIACAPDQFLEFTTDENDNLIVIDTRDLDATNCITEEGFVEQSNDMLSLFKVNAMITSLLLIVLIISSLCKVILSVRNIKDISIETYQIFAFLTVLLMVNTSTTIAFSNAYHNLFYAASSVLLAMPIGLTIFSIYKNNKKDKMAE